jgi:hypothetical protein
MIPNNGIVAFQYAFNGYCNQFDIVIDNVVASLLKARTLETGEHRG